MHDETFVPTVMAVVGLLFVAAISAVVTKWIRFPYTVGLVIVGVGVAFFGDYLPEVGNTLDNLKFGPAMIMFIFIPILIFESAFNTDVRLLMRNLVPSVIMAGPGLLLSTALVGGLLALLIEWPIWSALIFGCLISATDPVAVIALFKEVNAPKRLTVLVEGESVFNDATAIVTFQIILGVAATGVLDSATFITGVGSFFLVFFGGLALGLAFGYLVARAIPIIGDQPLVHITLTLVTAYAAFIIAEHFLHTSGIMAVLGAGLVIGYYGPELYSRRVREYLEVVWEDAVFVANSLIFLMLGLSEKVFITHTGSNLSGLLRPVLIAIAVVLIARFIVVYSIVPLLNRLRFSEPISGSYQAVMAWGGLRGAVAVALAISLPSTFPYRWQIIDCAFGVTLFMLVFNGTTMAWLIRLLRLDQPSLLEEIMATYAALSAKRIVLSRINTHQPVSQVGFEAIRDIRERYEKDVFLTEERLAALRQRIGNDRETPRRLLWQRAIAIERQVVQKRFEEGLLILDSYRALKLHLQSRDSAVRHHGRIDEPLLRIPRKPGSRLRELLQQIFGGIGILARWKDQERIALFQRITTVVAASSAVLEELDTLRGFTDAQPEDVEACRGYYLRLLNLANSQLEIMEGVFTSESEAARQSIALKIAGDLEIEAIRNLAETGELPEKIARTLEHEITAGQTLGV